MHSGRGRATAALRCLSTAAAAPALRHSLRMFPTAGHSALTTGSQNSQAVPTHRSYSTLEECQSEVCASAAPDRVKDAAVFCWLHALPAHDRSEHCPAAQLISDGNCYFIQIGFTCCLHAWFMRSNTRRLRIQVDAINDKFAEARDEIDYANEDAESTYFDESYKSAEAATNEVSLALRSCEYRCLYVCEQVL